jgi:hypothetical protein
MEGLDWIYVAQDRDGRRTVLETLVRFWFTKKVAIFGYVRGNQLLN